MTMDRMRINAIRQAHFGQWVDDPQRGKIVTKTIEDDIACQAEFFAVTGDISKKNAMAWLIRELEARRAAAGED